MIEIHTGLALVFAFVVFIGGCAFGMTMRRPPNYGQIPPKPVPRPSGMLLDPPPMPKVSAAQISIVSIKRVCDRAMSAWRAGEITDAIRSIRYFCDEAERAMKARKS